MKNVRWVKVLMISASFVLCGQVKIHAQSNSSQMSYEAEAQPEQKPADTEQTVKDAFEQHPQDVNAYREYLQVLLDKKKYKEAERLVKKELDMRVHDPAVYIDMGHVYMLLRKDKKANEAFNEALKYINGDDMVTQQIADAFQKIGEDEYAVQTFERASSIIGNPYIYGGQLAKLYAKTGNMDKAISALFDAGAINGLENTKITLLELLGNDPKKLELASKAIIKLINDQPDNMTYPELLTWLYTQKNDWDGALTQVEAMDARNSENGEQLISFAEEARRQGHYDIAIKCYDDVMQKGTDKQFYVIAASEKLKTKFEQLKNNPAYKPEDIAGMAKEYDTFLQGFPTYYGTETGEDYAILEAQYADDPQKGIDILSRAITLPNAEPEFIGTCKLLLGDYYILMGRVWDASLTYSQVDKQFRNDKLGEDARFRNAKLAYYRGDFKWAQDQLSVLKASTSELIANDALYLSVLITENIGPDSNMVPLQRFAYADLLLFQNKDKDAESLLDSISTAFPNHPLADDILMMRAEIAQKHRNYTEALTYLKQIYEQYGKDVLGDDAVYKTAEIYEKYLHQPAQAKHYYEQLVIDYPGSTYVQTARMKLQQLNSGTTLP